MAERQNKKQINAAKTGTKHTSTIAEETSEKEKDIECRPLHRLEGKAPSKHENKKERER